MSSHWPQDLPLSAQGLLALLTGQSSRHESATFMGQVTARARD